MRNNVTKILVGKSGGTANVGTALNNIKKGDIFLMNYETGAKLAGTGNTIKNTPAIQVVAGMGNGVFKASAPMYGKELTAAIGNDFVPDAAHVMSIGYNGTSGALTALANETYTGTIVYHDDLRLIANRQTRTVFSHFTGENTDVYDLAAAIRNDVNMQSDRYVDAAINANGTATAIAQTASVSRGSKVVTFNGAHGATLGGLLKFPGAGIYKVAKVVSTSKVELDFGYQGASDVFGSGEVSRLASTTMYGVTFTGIEIPTRHIDKYQHVTFEVGLSENFGIVPSLDVRGDKGYGLPIQIKEMELACSAMEGYTDHRSFDREPFNYQVDMGEAGYKTINLNGETVLESDLQSNISLPISTTIAFSSTADTQLDAFLAILNPYLESAGLNAITL